MGFWDQHSSWEAAEQKWTTRAQEAARKKPLRRLPVLPQIPGITEETQQRLKWKSLAYMWKHDTDGCIRRHIRKHPLRYGYRYLRSLCKRRSYVRDGDLFLYGFSSVEAFAKRLERKNTLLVVGCSYCQKPHECPSGRFTDACIRDLEHPVCQQCDIGQLLHALPPERTIPLLIPTIHYIGDKIFTLLQEHREKELLFLITACELTLEMFGDWGNMAGIRGIGVRLDGRICNTMQAFILSEKGIKPGLTLVLPETQQQILQLIKHMRSHVSS